LGFIARTIFQKKRIPKEATSNISGIWYLFHFLQDSAAFSAPNKPNHSMPDHLL